MKIGLIGGPQAGVSTLFEALTGGQSADAQRRSQMRIGNAKVPDERLAALARIYSPRKVVPAEVTYSELPKPNKSDELFSGDALGAIQKMDALALVVRAFNTGLSLADGALKELEQRVFDMRFQDIALLERRMERIKAESKSLGAGQRGAVERTLGLLQGIQERLEEGVSARNQEWDQSREAAVGDTFLVSRIPLLVILNIGEDDLPEAAAIEERARAALGEAGSGAVAICADLEYELGTMEPDEEAEMRREMGVGESALARLIALSYSVLGLISFLTAGEDEVRAWPIAGGTPAVEAARAIHSDIARGFVRAEVVGFEQFMELGSMAEARKRGLLRQEGKTYPIRDGDIVNYLFSV